MAATALSFSAANGGFESDWFQPNNPFQLDLLFPQSEIENTVRIFSANDNQETDADNYALATEFPLRHRKHLNAPVLKVIPMAGVYYKVWCRQNPTSASYMTE